MCRLLVHVEGQTEETFINGIVRPHLVQYGYTTVAARLIGNPRQRNRRGGICGWSQVRRDIIRHMREDSGAFTTTMVDYYALPRTGDKAWPGRCRASSLPFPQKAPTVEDALLEDISREIGGFSARQRFRPYVAMHEFEGMLFSDCDALAAGFGRPEWAPYFQQIRSQFASPEHIDDSPATAPSKRIEQVFPGYQKPSMGMRAVERIGLEAIRTECEHFREWLESLQTWPNRVHGQRLGS